MAGSASQRRRIPPSALGDSEDEVDAGDASSAVVRSSPPRAAEADAVCEGSSVGDVEETGEGGRVVLAGDSPVADGRTVFSVTGAAVGVEDGGAVGVGGVEVTVEDGRPVGVDGVEVAVGVDVAVGVGGVEVVVGEAVATDGTTEGEGSGVSVGEGRVGEGDKGVGADVLVGNAVVGTAVGGTSVGVAPDGVGVRVGIVCRFGCWPGLAHPAEVNPSSRITLAISNTNPSRPISNRISPLVICLLV
jgi:hypothetical protein